jgi:hypothetical protein
MRYLVITKIKATGSVNKDKTKECVILCDIIIFPGDRIRSR